MLTELEVKNKLGIDDFRSIKKDKLIEFVSNIPNMEKEVAIKCIEQFPNFKEYANTIVDHFYSLCDSAIKEDKKEDVVEYQKLLDSLHKILEEPEISEDERHFVIENMVIVAERLEIAVEKHNKFKENVLKIASLVGLCAIAVGSAILGNNMSLPKNDDESDRFIS